jgi:hypothetical protein
VIIILTAPSIYNSTSRAVKWTAPKRKHGNVGPPDSRKRNIVDGVVFRRRIN